MKCKVTTIRTLSLSLSSLAKWLLFQDDFICLREACYFTLKGTDSVLLYSFVYYVFLIARLSDIYCVSWHNGKRSSVIRKVIPLAPKHILTCQNQVPGRRQCPCQVSAIVVSPKQCCNEDWKWTEDEDEIDLWTKIFEERRSSKLCCNTPEQEPYYWAKQ